jgi:hypothetical protein
MERPRGRQPSFDDLYPQLGAEDANDLRQRYGDLRMRDILAQVILKEAVRHPEIIFLLRFLCALRASVVTSRREMSGLPEQPDSSKRTAAGFVQAAHSAGLSCRHHIPRSDAECASA